MVSSAFAGLMFTGGPEWEYDSPGLGGLAPAFALDCLGSFVSAGVCLGLLRYLLSLRRDCWFAGP